MMVLQDDVPDSYSETHPPLSHDSKHVHSIKVEKDSDIDEEENPVPLTFPVSKDAYEVISIYICVSAVRNTLHVSSLVYYLNSCLSLHLSIRNNQ
jgi:hypothetical protein